MFVCMTAFVNFFAFIIILQVRLGILDLQLHSEYIPDGTKTALDYVESVYKSTSLYPMLQEDRSFCTSSHIFTGLFSLSN